MRAWLVAGGLLAAIMTMSACSNGSGGSAGSSSSSSPSGSGSRSGSSTAGSAPILPETATAFLARYVTADGRVLRTDQGGDIVSESQSYGMLIAELAGRPALTRTIWQWTKAHLSRPDGLLAFHAKGDGTVLDPNPAADADILVAYALLRYRGPDQDALAVDGRRIAQAVLAHETVSVSAGPVVVAGTWATGSPATVNPSYWMPGVFSSLATMTGDERWTAAASTAVSMLRQLTNDGRQLPPDWAQLRGERLTASGAPDGSAGVRYSFDAARVPLWFAATCTGPARALAAAWWRSLATDDRASGAALSIDGPPIDPSQSPVALLAASAAAGAAGDSNRAGALAQRADQLARERPTYYGDAWVSLAAGLRQRALAPCPNA